MGNHTWTGRGSCQCGHGCRKSMLAIADAVICKLYSIHHATAEGRCAGENVVWLASTLRPLPPCAREDDDCSTWPRTDFQSALLALAIPAAVWRQHSLLRANLFPVPRLVPPICQYQAISHSDGATLSPLDMHGPFRQANSPMPAHCIDSTQQSRTQHNPCNIHCKPPSTARNVTVAECVFDSIPCSKHS